MIDSSWTTNRPILYEMDSHEPVLSALSGSVLLPFYFVIEFELEEKNYVCVFFYLIFFAFSIM